MYRTEKSLFMHIPKAGGTWTASGMRAAGCLPDMAKMGNYDGHDAWNEAKRWAKDRFVFTVVRNPITWLPSVFRWMADKSPGRRAWNRLPGPCSIFHEKIDQTESFRDFIKMYLERIPGAVTEIYNEYAKGCHFVLRNENIVDDLILALTLAGEKFDKEAIKNHEPQNVTAENIKQQGHPVELLPCEWNPMLEIAVREEDREVFKRYRYQKVTNV